MIKYTYSVLQCALYGIQQCCMFVIIIIFFFDRKSVWKVIDLAEKVKRKNKYQENTSAVQLRARRILLCT